MPNGRHAGRPQSKGPLLTQQFTISVSRPDGTSIPVVVTKKRVKNFNLRVTSSGEAHASAPLGASRERIEAFVKRNSAWIISRLDQREQHQATAREPLSPSSIIALWGKPITVQDALDHNFASPAPRPKQATFASFMGADKSNERPQAERRAILDGLTPDELQTRIDQLYASEVTTALRDMVHAYEIAMGIAVSRVSVRSMKTRWGLMHTQNRRHSHRARARRLPCRMPRHGCRPRARPLARAKPQSAVSRPARHVLPQQ